MKRYIKIFLGICLFMMYSSSVGASTISYGSTTGVTRCPLGWELIASQRGLSSVPLTGTLTCQLATPKLGVSYGNSITFGLNTGNTSCPAGQVLLDIDLSRYPGISGTLSCMRPDVNPPVISVNTNGYTDNTWTNQNVRFNVGVSDTWTGVKRVVYRVNGTQYLGSTSFILNFEEEGIYNVEIEAEDASTHELLYGEPVSVGNKTIVNYIVKIDKSSPALLGFGSSDTVNWIKEKPVINYRLVDTYKGKSIEQKTFICTGKPTNSERLTPVDSSGNLVGVCDPNVSDCSIDTNFLPHPGHPTMGCRWSCSGGFTKGEDDKCYSSTVVRTCTGIRTGVYKYNKNDIVTKQNDNVASFWTNPTGVMSNGEFIANFNPLTLGYTPYVSQCEQKCFPGTIEEFGNCVDEYATVCCQSSYALGTFQTTGAEVDCSLPINSTHVSCVYNSFCGGYIKDVMKQWNAGLNKWEYKDATETKDTLADLCGAIPIPNSNGTTCNPRYYLVGGGTASQKCEVVPIGQFSGQSNTKGDCNNKPINSTYTSNGTTNSNCEWSCNSGYHEEGGICTASTRSRSCNTKPSHTAWNSVSSITQTWNGSEWLPTRTSVYGETASTTECRFICNTGRTWNGSSCVNSSVNGVCGVANGTATENYPTVGFCSAGTKVDVDTNGSDGTYNWRCDGSGSGTDDICSAPKITYTYSWNTTSWSTCSVTCGGGTQTRTVTCQRNDGVTVADSYCTTTKPTTSQTCNTSACSPSSCTTSYSFINGDGGRNEITANMSGTTLVIMAKNIDNGQVDNCSLNNILGPMTYTYPPYDCSVPSIVVGTVTLTNTSIRFNGGAGGPHGAHFDSGVLPFDFTCGG